MLIVVKLVISRIRCLTFTWVGSMWLTGDNRHSCGFIPGKWSAVHEMEYDIDCSTVEQQQQLLHGKEQSC